MLKAEGISLIKDGNVILKDVSCRFEKGSLGLILGPNGAGKSSLVKILAGLQQPDSGTVHYGDRDMNSFSLAELAKSRAVLSQNIDVAFQLSVTEVVMMGRSPHFVNRPAQADEKACREAMAFFGIKSLAARQYLTLSGGEKQRVQFARVLAQIWENNTEQRYLFLDEPLTFLDIHHQLDFMKKVRTLLEQSSLVVVGVVHDLNLAARYADSLLLLNNGRVHAAGGVREVLSPANIDAVYRVQCSVHESGDRLHLLF